MQSKLPDFTRHLTSARHRVRLVTDNSSALALAVKAGLAVSMAAVPPRVNGVAVALGRLPGAEWILVIRWHGYADARDNGWLALVGSADALQRIRHIVSRILYGAAGPQHHTNLNFWKN